jgi:hypothetical protein
LLIFDATAGRTQHGYGEECECGLPAPPECYDEITLQRCDTGVGGGGNIAAPDEGDANKSATEVPTDYPSAALLLFLAAYLTSRAIRFP